MSYRPKVHKRLVNVKPLDKVNINLNFNLGDDGPIKAKYITDEYIIFRYDSSVERATLRYDVRTKELVYIGNGFDHYNVFENFLFAANTNSEYESSNKEDLLHIYDINTAKERTIDIRSKYLKVIKNNNGTKIYSQDSVKYLGTRLSKVYGDKVYIAICRSKTTAEDDEYIISNTTYTNNIDAGKDIYNEDCEYNIKLSYDVDSDDFSIEVEDPWHIMQNNSPLEDYLDNKIRNMDFNEYKQLIINELIDREGVEGMKNTLNIYSDDSIREIQEDGYNINTAVCGMQMGYL